jgi:DNA-binding NarL/FixJ family response regulator
MQDSPFKTLIVEDNASFRQSLAETLQARFPDMVIEEATEGEEAFQKIEALRPHLIFVDIKLRGESGLELTKRIKADYPGVIVIILTHYDFVEYREAAYQYGANHFLSKTSSSGDQILALVESIYNKHEAARWT